MKSMAAKAVALTLTLAAAAATAQTSPKAPGWAQVRVSVACVRENPGHAAELGSQLLMGTPVEIDSIADSWCRVTTPEGYRGWVIDNSLAAKTDEEMARWRSSRRWTVTNIQPTNFYRYPDAQSPRQRVSDAVDGMIVEGVEIPGTEWVEVTLPDARRGYARRADLTPTDQWADQDFDPDKILDIAYSMEGEPYLWGGTSTKSCDCSGLSKLSYFHNGIILKRNASQQALTGRRVEAKDWPTLRSGDLLFFGNPETGRVTHVAIYDHDGNYVHSSGRVKRNSVDPSSPAYLPTPFLWAVNISDSIGTPGITRVIDHPWYFNQPTDKTSK
jgi:SH3-like domain-containing protein